MKSIRSFSGLIMSIYFGLLVPLIAHEIMSRLYKDIALYISIASVPLTILMIIMIPHNPERSIIYLSICKIITAISLIITGFAFEWHYWEEDLWAFIAMDMVLIFGSASISGDLLFNIKTVNKSFSIGKMLLLGLIATIFGFALLIWSKWSLLLWFCSILFVISALIQLGKEEQDEGLITSEFEKDNSQWSNSNNMIFWGIVFCSLFTLCFFTAELLTSTTRGPYGDQLWNWVWLPRAFLFFTLGQIFILALKQFRIKIWATLIILIVAPSILYFIELTNKFEFVDWLNVTLISFSWGIGMRMIHDLWVSNQNPNYRIEKTKISILFILVAGAVYGGYSMVWDIIYQDGRQSGYIGLILIGLGTVFLILGLFRPKMQNEVIQRTNPINIPKTRKNQKIKATLVGILIIIPTTIPVLFATTGNLVGITLIEPMYDVYGNEVNQLWLTPWSAKILYKSPIAASNQTAISTSSIRSNMNVRLGGYFYGLWGPNRTSYDLNWTKRFIGNNLDVWACGQMGLTFNPSDVLDVRALNPSIKIYYQSYQTSLFENLNPEFNNVTPGQAIIGNTNMHYALTNFNETILNMTLKNKDGDQISALTKTTGQKTRQFMDPGNLEWADLFAEIYGTLIEYYHCDGTTIDEISWDSFWGIPFSELQDYNSPEDIENATYRWLARVDEKADYELLSTSWWDDAQQFQNGIWGEVAHSSRVGTTFWGPPYDDRYIKTWHIPIDWFGLVNMTAKISAQNKTYIWAAWYTQNNTQELEYAIATYLMGTDPSNPNVVFHPQPIYDYGYGSEENYAGYGLSVLAEEIFNHPEFYNITLGKPIEDMQIISAVGGNLVKREFENGCVYVNPYHPHFKGLLNLLVDTRKPAYKESEGYSGGGGSA